ncbi:hypothetical protein AMECASPLE_002615 [Ameca splendens]|uniref:Uncharacterized protein n=1 Tax=Ameca splendens TaxID=208324 RepID=A0ABV0YKQ3_9TELE
MEGRQKDADIAPGLWLEIISEEKSLDVNLCSPSRGTWSLFTASLKNALLILPVSVDDLLRECFNVYHCGTVTVKAGRGNGGGLTADGRAHFFIP